MNAAPPTAPTPAPAAEPTPPPALAPATAPYPPRFRWLRRLTLAAVVLCLMLAALRVVWGRIVSGRLDPVLAELRARGEPINPEDLKPPPPPEGEAAAGALNAVPLLNQAMPPTSYSPQAITYDPPSQTNMEYPDHPPFSAKWDRIARRAIVHNSNSLALARQARLTRPYVDWRLPLAPGMINIRLPMLGGARYLACLLGDAALYAQVHGDDVEAIERVRDARFVARAVDEQPLLISHLVAMGCEAIALNRLAVIAPGLTIEPESPPAGPAATIGATATTLPVRRPATRAQVRGLIAELLRDASDSRPLRRCLQGERVMQTDTIHWSSAKAWALRPMFELEVLHATTDMNDCVRAADQPNWRAATTILNQRNARAAAVAAPGGAALTATSRSGGGPVRLTRMMSRLLMPALNRVIATDFHVRASRRIAAVSLAAQLYRADHNGAWPDKLEAMVPEYLPQLPVDPMAPDGSPLHYLLLAHGRPDGQDRPIAYSVSEDGHANTADDPSVIPAKPLYAPESQHPLDDWRDLSRWSTHAPTSAPATGPAVDL